MASSSDDTKVDQDVLDILERVEKESDKVCHAPSLCYKILTSLQDTEIERESLVIWNLQVPV